MPDTMPENDDQQHKRHTDDFRWPRFVTDLVDWKPRNTWESFGRFCLTFMAIMAIVVFYFYYGIWCLIKSVIDANKQQGSTQHTPDTTGPNQSGVDQTWFGPANNAPLKTCCKCAMHIPLAAMACPYCRNNPDGRQI